MKGTMQISKLKKKAAYYCSKSFDKRYGGELVFFIEPFDGTYDKCFYYVKVLKNGKIEITGEGYIISDLGRIASYRKESNSQHHTGTTATLNGKYEVDAVEEYAEVDLSRPLKMYANIR